MLRRRKSRNRGDPRGRPNNREGIKPSPTEHKRPRLFAGVFRSRQVFFLFFSFFNNFDDLAIHRLFGHYQHHDQVNQNTRAPNENTKDEQQADDGRVNIQELAQAAGYTSKHAVIGLMKSAAREFAAEGIRVNTVNPSPVQTRMMRSIEAGIRPEDPQGAQESMATNIPMQRYAEPEDIANIMLFLASDESHFVTGSTYFADGSNTA